MATAKVRERGQVTIPKEVRRRAHLEEGDVVEMEVTEEGILLRPKRLVDASQAWFWTTEWQEGERQAEREIAGGLGTTYESGEDFLAALRAREHESADA